MHILVSPNASKNPNPPVVNGSKPDHWADDAGTTFQNPWKSWRSHTISDRVGVS